MNKYERFLLEVESVETNRFLGDQYRSRNDLPGYTSGSNFQTPPDAKGYSDIYTYSDTKGFFGNDYSAHSELPAGSDPNTNYLLNLVARDRDMLTTQLHFTEDIAAIMSIATMLLTLLTGLLGIKGAWNFYRKIKQAAINVNMCNKFKDPNQKNQCKLRLYKTTRAELMSLRSQCSKDRNAQNCVAKFNKQITKIDNMINKMTQGQG